MERSESDQKSKNLLVRALERCRSLGRRRRRSVPTYMSRSKSWEHGAAGSSRRQRTPGGCFTVYVGPRKERFVIKMECINHPLFKVLLDEAEKVFGFSSPGPLELPCEVEQFYKVLCEMDQELVAPANCGLTTKGGSPAAAGYRRLSSSRLIVTGSF